MPYAVHLICSTALLHDALCALSPSGHYSFLIYHSQVNNQRDLLFTPAFISHCCFASLSLFICDHTYVQYTCESFFLLTEHFHFIPRFLKQFFYFPKKFQSKWQTIEGSRIVRHDVSGPLILFVTIEFIVRITKCYTEKSVKCVCKTSRRQRHKFFSGLNFMYLLQFPSKYVTNVY